jgi:hypothetical protein
LLTRGINYVATISTHTVIDISNWFVAGLGVQWRRTGASAAMPRLDIW